MPAKMPALPFACAFLIFRAGTKLIPGFDDHGCCAFVEIQIFQVERVVFQNQLLPLELLAVKENYANWTVNLYRFNVVVPGSFQFRIASHRELFHGSAKSLLCEDRDTSIAILGSIMMIIALVLAIPVLIMI